MFRQESTAVNGKRLGSRVLGIGADSFVLALRTLLWNCRGPYLANNPWIGVALRLTGRRNFAVTGIYAEPGSRSWRILRRLVGDVPVVTLSESETAPWNGSGGRSIAVLYGNTFGYPKKQPSDEFHIFVGGTSDRDQETIRLLEQEVLASSEPVRLTLAVGGTAGEVVSGTSVVCRPGRLNPDAFGDLMSTATVVFLPLRDGTRAAGHMVLVGALETGLPVGVTPSRGMKEYVQGPSIVLCDPEMPLLPQLRLVSQSAEGNDESIRCFWQEVFSLNAYIGRVGEALEAAYHPVRAERGRRTRDQRGIQLHSRRD
ncbi:hypothetical protein [Arthrobacter sp. SRS-W-1-2016]|uniref:hypothetical protein n=1 Tax=Arthrobacter sp. SRS-W-1-2016 TaxID=1930254 RepID=UPI001116BA69|nr:hypothetical protein [Arthrobacter sp. SRS-W-1-2016]